MRLLLFSAPCVQLGGAKTLTNSDLSDMKRHEATRGDTRRAPVPARRRRPARDASGPAAHKTRARVGAPPAAARSPLLAATRLPRSQLARCCAVQSGARCTRCPVAPRTLQVHCCVRRTPRNRAAARAAWRRRRARWAGDGTTHARGTLNPTCARLVALSLEHLRLECVFRGIHRISAHEARLCGGAEGAGKGVRGACRYFSPHVASCRFMSLKSLFVSVFAPPNCTHGAANGHNTVHSHTLPYAQWALRWYALHQPRLLQPFRRLLRQRVSTWMRRRGRSC